MKEAKKGAYCFEFQFLLIQNQLPTKIFLFCSYFSAVNFNRIVVTGNEVTVETRLGTMKDGSDTSTGNQKRTIRTIILTNATDETWNKNMEL